MRSWCLVLTAQLNTDWCWWWLRNSPLNGFPLSRLLSMHHPNNSTDVCTVCVCVGGGGGLESKVTHCQLKEPLCYSFWVTFPCWWWERQASVPSIHTRDSLSSRSYRWLQEALSSRWTNRMTWLRKDRKVVSVSPNQINRQVMESQQTVKS